MALSPGAIGNLGTIRNPLGIEGLANGYKPVQTIMFALLFVAAVSTLVLRLHGARGIERQQIKWPAYTAVVAAGGSVLTEIISEAKGSVWLGWLGYVLSLIGLIGFPISIGIAIVRYHLYEIDTLINRTPVYALLTAILAAVYFGAVVLLQRLFVALSGEKSTLAVVTSTLVIAALFNPLRRWVQVFVDQRFYRRKYDAAKTLQRVASILACPQGDITSANQTNPSSRPQMCIMRDGSCSLKPAVEAFSVKLRDETDLNALSEDLVGVVRETMQPAHISLWLLSATLPQSEESD